MGVHLGVDLELTEDLHDYFKDYQPAPSKEVVELADTSNDQFETLGKIVILS